MWLAGGTVPSNGCLPIRRGHRRRFMLMAARLSCALLVCAAASTGATFVCGGDVQITQGWDGTSIEGHCDGDYEGAEFMPGDRVPFPDGPLLSGTLPAKLALNSGIETLWLKNNLISGTMAQEQSHLGDHPIRVGWDEDVEGAGPVWRAPLGHCSDPAWASGRDDDAQLVANTSSSTTPSESAASAACESRDGSTRAL